MTKTAFVIAPSQPDEFWTEERCYITEVLNDPKVPEFSLAIARVEPGVTTQLHALRGISEIYILRQGEGIAEVDGKEIPLNAGLSLLSPKALRRDHVRVIRLEFYCHCAPFRYTGLYQFGTVTDIS